MVILLLFSSQMNDSICEVDWVLDKNVQKPIAEIISFYFTSRITNLLFVKWIRTMVTVLDYR